MAESRKEALMSNRPLRFIHASDLHLDQPACGIAEVPDHLREVLVESPFWAAERLFETVLAEDAELLVLSGDVLDPEKTGPYGPLFLVAQFERLAERGIEVYWAAGRADPTTNWPAFAPLPPSVHLFPSERLEHFLHQRDGTPVARLTGVSRPHGRVRAKDFSPDPSGLFSIAAIYGKANPEALRPRGIDYWALGGGHARSTPFSSPQVAHWPGSPQGRRPEEPGPHGCSLVEVDADRRVRIAFVPCDVLRWHAEQVAIDPAAGPKDLERRLHDRAKTLREAAPGIDLMVSWTVVGSGRLAAQLRRGTLAAELLQGLRSQFGMAQPAVWSVSLAAEAAPTLPAQWYEQDTIRGDFLREVRRLQLSAEEPIGLEAHVPEPLRTGPLARAAVLEDGADRQRVLREAAALGADLLSGEGPLP
jgi:DNA repair exonuclease SbcCD nuclease subunit